MITSSSNAKVKNIIALQKKPKERREQGLFVVEGRKLVGEVPAGWISEVYISESYAADCSYSKASGQQDAMCSVNLDGVHLHTEVLSDELFAKVSDTRTPQGILALVRMPSYEFPDLMGSGISLSSRKVCRADDEAALGEADDMASDGEDLGHQQKPLLLILEDIQDPGNLGTILRSAEGAGVTGVVMSCGTADVFNPKVVRSTMGSIYRVPFLVAENLQDVIFQIKSEGVKLYAAHLKGTSDYDAFDYCKSCAFMIGNEANGLKDETAALADEYVRIPMCGRVESLNAAVSASLLSYEAARQRRKRSFD